MPTPVSINIQTPQIAGAPQISITELEQKIQEYVNSLYVSVYIPKTPSSVKHHHSLSSLRGICKSGISDKQAIDDYLAEKYQDMRIFVDTNIVSELLEERSQVDYIDRIFEKAEQDGWTRVLSVGSFYTIHF